MSEQPERRGPPDSDNWKNLGRKAGCLWGCLTEPLVLVILAVGTLIGWRLLGQRSRSRREKGEGKDERPADR
jgi:hypothetical protein